MGMLDGIRVLDLSRLLPGPACTAWLAGQGASVDRIEAPGRGDFTRHIPPFLGDTGAYFVATSKGKRSLAVDLRSEEGVALIRRLVPRYDVVVEGFRPGVMEAMGLGPDVLTALRPGLVVARLSGYGQAGPMADRVGHDINYIGMAGMLAASTRTDEGLVLPVCQVADVGGALIAAAGIASALFRRERTGQGAVLDVSLTEAALWFQAHHVLADTASGMDPAPGTPLLSGGLPSYGTYRCADGKWVTLGALEPKFQLAVASHTEGDLGRPALTALFASQSRDAWLQTLSEACIAPVLGASELHLDEHLVARDAVRRLAGVTWVRPPLGDLPEGPVPGVGEQTDEVLAEAGLAPDDIAALRAGRVVA